MGQSASTVDGQVDEIVQSTGTHIFEFEGKSPGLIEIALYNLTAIVAVGLALGIWRCLSNCNGCCRRDHRTVVQPATHHEMPTSSAAVAPGCPHFIHHPSSFHPLIGYQQPLVHSWLPAQGQSTLMSNTGEDTQIPRILLDPVALMAQYHHLRRERYLGHHGRLQSAPRQRHASVAGTGTESAQSSAPPTGTSTPPPPSAPRQKPHDQPDSVSVIMDFQ